MNKFSIFLQILSKNIFKPKNILNLVKERVEVQDDAKHKIHGYEYDYNSIEEFFKDKFPDIDLIQYELELNEIETHVDNFLTKINLEKYPSAEKPYPVDYSINPNSRNFLYFLCRILKPKIVIETGVAYGFSSIYILKALEHNNSGKLYSIDSIFRPWQSKKMIGSVIPEKLRNRWNLILGSSHEKLQEVFDSLDDPDIFIHDSLHSYKNMIFEFECATNNLKHGMIISDDILDNDAFYDFTSREKMKNMIIKVQDDVGLGIIEKI